MLILFILIFLLFIYKVILPNFTTPKNNFIISQNYITFHFFSDEEKDSLYIINNSKIIGSIYSEEFVCCNLTTNAELTFKVNSKFSISKTIDCNQKNVYITFKNNTIDIYYAKEMMPQF